MAKRILGIFAHEDDEVIGAGGLFALNSDQGGTNHVVCVTGYDDSRVQELEAATEILGATYEVLGHSNTVDQLVDPLVTKLRDAIRKHHPDILITHHPEFDYNDDHLALAEIVLQAAMRASSGMQQAHRVGQILYTETHNLFPFPDQAYDITGVMERKLRAMACHESQLLKSTIPQGYYRDLVQRKAELRGLQAGCQYGEAFVTKRLPIIGPFGGKPLARIEI